MKLLKFPLLLFLALAGTSSFAVPVNGKVLDYLGRPVSFNVVTVTDLQIGCNGGADGTFELDLPPGRHELVFRGLGFNTFTQTIEVRDEGQRMVVFLEPTEEIEEAIELDHLKLQVHRFRKSLLRSDWDKELVPGNELPRKPGVYLLELP